jgi:hypothetical protein
MGVKVVPSLAIERRAARQASKYGRSRIAGLHSYSPNSQAIETFNAREIAAAS